MEFWWSARESQVGVAASSLQALSLGRWESVVEESAVVLQVNREYSVLFRHFEGK